jgi:hypothetical protein
MGDIAGFVQLAKAVRFAPELPDDSATNRKAAFGEYARACAGPDSAIGP